MVFNILSQGGETVKKYFILAAFIPTFILGCGKDDKPDPKPDSSVFASLFRFDSQGSGLTITDFEGVPVANAQILIGNAQNDPFSGNFISTDAQGKADLPSGWTSAQSVTVSAPGFLRATYLQQSPGPLTIQLHHAAGAQKYELSGKATNLDVTDFDDAIDFGLVMPAIAKMDLLNFDLGSVISSQLDHISTLGQDIPVPSNISLPYQQESYSILTATLDKPAYRTLFEEAGVKHMFVLRGKFPFGDVVDTLRNGGSFVDVINSFEISGGGLRDVTLSSKKTNLDLSTTDLNFTDQRSTTAPVIHADETFVAVATSNRSGYMIPTDIKTLESGKSATLSLLPQSESSLLAVLKKTADLKKNPQANGNPISASLVPFVANTPPSLLPLLAAPRVSPGGDLILPSVSPVSGIAPILTYSVLSQMKQVQDGDDTVTQTSRLWEVYAPQWVTNVKMPTWPNDPVVSGKKRWDVSFVGGQNASQGNVSPAMVNQATHVTRSTLDF